MSRLNELIQQYCPDGVEYKPLGEVCDFRNGFAFKSNLFTNEGCPIIRITNISENNVDMSDLKYFHMEDYPKSDLSQFAIKKGDILVAMSGATTGKIGTYKRDITAYLNQRTGKFEPKECLNNRFLYHFLLTQVSNMYKMADAAANSGNNFYPQTKYLLNLSYLRLKNLTIGYTLPKELTNRISLEKVRIYFSGEN